MVYTIKSLKKGEFFKLKENSIRVYIRGEYDKSMKKYSCVAFDDICVERMFNGNKEVFTEFEF